MITKNKTRGGYDIKYNGIEVWIAGTLQEAKQELKQLKNEKLNKLELEYISQLLGLDIMKFQDKNQDKPFLNNILKKVNKQISEL